MSDEKAAEPSMPVENLTDALPLLRRPFMPGAVKWKVQSTGPKGKPAEYAIVVGYIDARLVAARLNKVVGGNWSEKPVRIEGQTNALMYELTVFDQTHVDVGVGQGHTDDMKLKAVHSDGLKRPAVRFGVGECLYAMPQVILSVTEDGAEHSDGSPTIKRRRDGKAGSLRDNHEAFIRERYESWLRQEGIAAFGEPLDHGDSEAGSVGEGALVEDDTPVEASAEPLSTDKAKRLAAECRHLRDRIRAYDDGALPHQTFDNALTQREHSHERLEDFVRNLTELLANVERFTVLEGELGGKLDAEDLKSVVERAKRRASRSERVEVLEAALAEAEAPPNEEES